MPLVEDCISLQNRIWVQPNEWNHCLDQEASLWQAIIARGGLEMVCQTMRTKRYLRAPWTEMPPEGERLMKPAGAADGGSISPTFDGLDHLILSFTMPVGWDGVATAIMLTSTDKNFVEGSGAITWRVQVGKRWIPDFSNVIFSLSNLGQPHALVGGYIRLLSLQTIQIFANVAIGAPIDPNSRINAAVVGWQYPKR